MEMYFVLKKPAIKPLVIAGADLEGRVTGHLQNVLPISGLKALMEANGFRVRTRNGIYLIEAEEENEAATGRRSVEERCGYCCQSFGLTGDSASLT